MSTAPPDSSVNSVPPNRRWIWPFELIEQIGEGGMGVVYRARYVVNNREVALKMLPADVTDKVVMARFERELDVLKSLKHPNIVRCFGGQCEDKARFYAMELVTGGTLESELQRKGKLGWESVLEYGFQMCDALEEAHRQGVVHRDVKPGNFLLTPDGQLKLSDFGLAAVQAARKITQAGKTAGTFLYMAPEQIRGQDVTPRTDLYALGCVFYELLTGVPPFIGDTPASTLHKHLKDPAPRVAATVLDCPPALDQLVARLMEKVPEKRYQSAGDVRLALSSIVPTIEIRTPRRAIDALPKPSITAPPVDRRQLKRSTDETPVPVSMPYWLPTAIAGAFVLSLILNMQMFSHMNAARAWESSYIESLSNSSPEVRAFAARQLGQSPWVTNRGVTALLKSLSEDQDLNVRLAAADGLAGTGRKGKGTLPTLLKLEKESTDQETRVAAGNASRQIRAAPLTEGLGGILNIVALILGIGGIAFVALRDRAGIKRVVERIFLTLSGGRSR